MITVGMNYEVLPGKGELFESVFNKVLTTMQQVEHHQQTHLYRDVNNDCRYMIVSQWSNRDAFDKFIASERFKGVVDWGKEQVLAARQKHEVYESAAPVTKGSSPAAGCPMHGGQGPRA